MHVWCEMVDDHATTLQHNNSQSDASRISAPQVLHERCDHSQKDSRNADGKGADDVASQTRATSAAAARASTDQRVAPLLVLGASVHVESVDEVPAVHTISLWSSVQSAAVG